MKVFGFPTSIRPGFWLFSALLVFFYPFPLGLWIAIAVAVFTLIHELGHAFAARAAGCRASIALDFMIAYASFEPARPLTWGQRARIAFAGPGLQMLIGTIVLFALGVNPVSRGDITSSNVALAIWWSSIALGALNLIPLLPLDGGAIVESVAERVFPSRGRMIVLKGSIAITASILTIAVMTGFIGLIPISAFLLLMQYQTLAAPQKLRALLSDPSLSPQGNPAHDSMITEALISAGQHDRALSYARHAYAECPAFANALGAARAALSMNDSALAIHWLSTAEKSQLEKNELPRALAETNFFDALKSTPGVSPQWFTN
jgi:Zn-dependent protease